jgi:hypothetical protein
MPSHFLRHGLVGGVPSGGDTSLFLQERDETGICVYQEDVLQGGVKQLNMTHFCGQEWVFQQDCFGGHGLPKASQQPGQSEEIHSESSGRDPTGDGACRDSRVTGASQDMSPGRGRPF